MFIMCPPVYFDVIHYGLNPYMKKGTVIDKEKAMNQWLYLYNMLQSFNVKIHLIEPVKNLPDMVFSANCGCIMGDVFYPTNFKDLPRRGEVSHYTNYIRKMGYKIKRIDGYFEGQGDVVFSNNRKKVWIGYNQRTNLKGANDFKNKLIGNYNDIEVITLKLIDPFFYHLDTCMRVFGEDYVIYYPGAFDEKSRTKILAGFKKSNIITATRKEALEFCCNSIDIPHSDRNCNGILIANKLSDRLKNVLESKKVMYAECPMTEFMLGGGSVKCCIFEI